MDAIHYLLGVDGGGTKTDAWIARCDGAAEPAIIGRGAGASSNPRAVGLSTALANLGAAVDAAWRDAGLAPQSAAVAVLAMSGAGHPAVRSQVAAWAERRNLAVRLEQVHDADPVLAAGTPDGSGVALIVGTGSSAVGADSAGRREVVGGWGYWFGDEGSAFWIGRRALDAVARAADGRGAPTALTAAVLAHLKADEPRGMLAALEATGDARSATAGLARLVTVAAAQGDAAAVAIIAAAADELAETVACLAGKLALGDEFPLALTGGVACGSELLRDHVVAALARRSRRPEPVTIVPHPAAGCVQLALRLAASA
jgi:N-acetylglucosamine kinase-like BadF-type ATPase